MRASPAPPNPLRAKLQLPLTHSRRPPAPVSPCAQARNCFCLQAPGATVDCTTCKCSACARPTVPRDSTLPLPAVPFYLNAAGNCVR